MQSSKSIQKSFHSYSHYVQSSIQTNATRLWVPADIVHSYPDQHGAQTIYWIQGHATQRQSKHHDLKKLQTR